MKTEYKEDGSIRVSYWPLTLKCTNCHMVMELHVPEEFDEIKVEELNCLACDWPSPWIETEFNIVDDA